MVARRTQTTQGDQPVRFYKFVALTFLAITLILFGVIVFLSSKRAQIIITTKPEAINITTSVGVNDKTTTRSISGAVLSTTTAGSTVFQPTGTREEPGIAKGVVTLHNDSSLDQPLIATTRLLTEDGVLFRIADRALVPANGTVEVAVYADVEGAGGDIPASRFTVPGLNQTKQAQIYATSETPMTGGISKIGIVSQDDIDKATKILLADLRTTAETTLGNTDTSQKGVFAIGDSSVTPSVAVGDEVSEFTVSGTATLVGVFYTESDILALANDVLMSRAIDDAEYISASETPPTVSLISQDIASNTAVLDVTYTGRATINPESKQLSSSMFYGKSKDEVRRYLLSLDHVYGVDVNLRPAWTQTVPHVSDHVDIIVKQVE